jgi:ADP-ribose pyrophosphatase
LSRVDVTHVFSGRVIEVNIERVELPNGTTASLEIIRHPGGAAVLALDDANRVCLLRQFRHAAGGWVWELPAGKIDNREPPLATAQRELEEEAGVAADSWQSLGDYLSSPGVFTEVVHLFLATRLTQLAQRPEEHEVFEVHWLPFADVLQMARSGELRDGKSLVAVFRAATHVSAAG